MKNVEVRFSYIMKNFEAIKIIPTFKEVDDEFVEKLFKSKIKDDGFRTEITTENKFDKLVDILDKLWKNKKSKVDYNFEEEFQNEHKKKLTFKNSIKVIEDYIDAHKEQYDPNGSFKITLRGTSK